MCIVFHVGNTQELTWGMRWLRIKKHIMDLRGPMWDDWLGVNLVIWVGNYFLVVYLSFYLLTLEAYGLDNTTYIESNTIKGYHFHYSNIQSCYVCCNSFKKKWIVLYIKQIIVFEFRYTLATKYLCSPIKPNILCHVTDYWRNCNAFIFT